MTPKKGGDAPAWGARFLATLAETANVSESALAAHVSRNTCYRTRKANEAFRLAWEDAIEQGADALESEARRRAVKGVDEPVFYKGEQCGAVRKYSDTLLIFLLKGARPEKYRERQDIKHDGDVIIRVVDETEDKEGSGTEAAHQ